MLVGRRLVGLGSTQSLRDPGSFCLTSPLPSPRMSEFSMGFLASTWKRREIEAVENDMGGLGVCFKPWTLNSSVVSNSLWSHGACQAPLSMGILQARILEWVAMSSSRGSSQSSNWTQVFLIAGKFFTIWTTREALKPRIDVPHSVRNFPLTRTQSRDPTHPRHGSLGNVQLWA